MSSPAVSDAHLIARVLVQDDRHAFGELVRRHQSVVRATLRKLTGGNHALADDLAQETFLLAYRNLRSFRQEAKFSTWLYRIAYNAFLADTRKMKELPLPDDGFTANVLGRLPQVVALPAWRRPVVALLWLIAGCAVAVALPGLFYDVFHSLIATVFGQALTLSRITVALTLLGALTWSTIVYAVREE